jgi:hypothetical protein
MIYGRAAQRSEMPFRKHSSRWRRANLCVVYAVLLHPNGPAYILQLYRASSAVSKGVADATEPIRKTEAYKALEDTILDALDDSGSAKHAGYEEKEVRRLRRKLRLEKAGRAGGLNTRTRVVADEKCVKPLTHRFKSIHLLSSALVKQLFSTRTMRNAKNGKILRTATLFCGNTTISDNNTMSRKTQLFRVCELSPPLSEAGSTKQKQHKPLEYLDIWTPRSPLRLSVGS